MSIWTCPKFISVFKSSRGGPHDKVGNVGLGLRIDILALLGGRVLQHALDGVEPGRDGVGQGGAEGAVVSVAKAHLGTGIIT